MRLAKCLWWPYWVKYVVLVIKNKTKLANIQSKLRFLRENIADCSGVWLVDWLIKQTSVFYFDFVTDFTTITYPLTYTSGKLAIWTYFQAVLCTSNIFKWGEKKCMSRTIYLQLTLFLTYRKHIAVWVLYTNFINFIKNTPWKLFFKKSSTKQFNSKRILRY